MARNKTSYSYAKTSRLKPKQRFSFARVDIDYLDEYNNLITQIEQPSAAGMIFEHRKKSVKQQTVKGRFFKTKPNDKSQCSLGNQSISANFPRLPATMHKITEFFHHTTTCISSEAEQQVVALDCEVDGRVAVVMHSLCVSPIINQLLGRSSCVHFGLMPSCYEIPLEYHDELRGIHDAIIAGKNPYLVKRVKLLSFVKRLHSAKNMTKFLLISIQMLQCIYLNSDEDTDTFGVFLSLWAYLEQACDPAAPETPLCPGLVFIAPPGMGKTHFNLSHPYGMIDTDSLKTSIRKETVIIERLARAGFSLITNCWEWREWSVGKVAFFPRSLPLCLESKLIFTKERFDEIKNHRRDFFRSHKHLARSKDSDDKFNRRSSPGRHRNAEEWIAAYRSIDTANDVLYYTGDNFAHCFSDFLRELGGVAPKK